MSPIYLDHNATTAIDPRVAAAMGECYAAGYVNPTSQHDAGRQARRVVESARRGIAEIVGAKTTGMDADSVVFTSGGTEANNLAVLGLGETPPTRVITSAIEHPSVTAAAEQLAAGEAKVERLKVNPHGVIQPDDLRELLARDEASRFDVISTMLANNETGVIQPVADLAQIARDAGAYLHTDAVQVVGKLPVDFTALGVDAMTLTAHKFHGPRGVGALVVRHGVPLRPQLHGGFQQAGLRPGTEDVALVVGLHTALKLWQAEAEERQQRLTGLRNLFESLLREAMPRIEIIGEAAPRLPHTSCVAFVGHDRQALVMALDLAGVACSTGSACASGSSEPSPVLLAMGLPGEVVESALRFSLGATTTEAEIREAVLRVVSVVRRAANDTL